MLFHVLGSKGAAFMDPEPRLSPEPDPQFPRSGSSSPWPGRDLSPPATELPESSKHPVSFTPYNYIDNPYPVPPPKRSNLALGVFACIVVLLILASLLFVTLSQGLLSPRSPTASSIPTSTPLANLSTASPNTGSQSPTTTDVPTMTVGSGTSTAPPAPVVPGYPYASPAPTVAGGPGIPTPTNLPTSTSAPPKATP